MGEVCITILFSSFFFLQLPSMYHYEFWFLCVLNRKRKNQRKTKWRRKKQRKKKRKKKKTRGIKRWQGIQGRIYATRNHARHNVHPLVLATTEIRLLLWIFGSFYLCKCVWVLFRIYASIGSEPSNLKKPLILSSSNDVTLKLTSLTALL